MSYYIIIRGPAGVGKSTISRLLASRIGASVTHFDKVLEELGIDEVVDNKWIPLDRFLKANEVTVPKIRMELEKNRNVVIDGNFYHMEQINDLLNKLDFPHEAFTLKADLSECIKRDGMRETPLGKKGIDDVFRLVSAFDYGNVIHTDGKTPGEVVEEIAAILGA